MYNDKKKHNKILSIVSIIILIYLFTLSLGYAFFSEELVISGNVSTASGKPKDCPLEMQKITYDIIPRYDYFIIEVPYALGGGTLAEVMMDGFGSINFYNKEKNIASFYSSTAFLVYSFAGGAVPGLTYIAPIYIALKNVSSYDLKSWTIKIDYDNVRKDENGQPVVSAPIDYFNVWWEPTDGDFSNWEPPYVTVVDTVEAYDVHDRNSFFKNTNVASDLFEILDYGESKIPDYSYRGYAVKDFYNLKDGVTFETDPIGTGESIVIGIMFPKVSTTTEVPAEMDGLSFKIYENSFSEESAFKVRMAFDIYETFTNWTAIRAESPSDFQEKFESEHPVPWWQ